MTAGTTLPRSRSERTRAQQTRLKFSNLITRICSLSTDRLALCPSKLRLLHQAAGVFWGVAAGSGDRKTLLAGWAAFVKFRYKI